MSKVIIKYCKTCQLYNAVNKTCALMPNLQGRIKEEDYCSQHKDEVHRCTICGMIVLYPLVITDNQNQVRTICSNCMRQFL